MSPPASKAICWSETAERVWPAGRPCDPPSAQLPHACGPSSSNDSGAGSTGFWSWPTRTVFAPRVTPRPPMFPLDRGLLSQGCLCSHRSRSARPRCLFAPFPRGVSSPVDRGVDTLHCAPTSRPLARTLPGRTSTTDKIVVSGNTVIDFRCSRLRLRRPPPPTPIIPKPNTILLTAHRRENFGERAGRCLYRRSRAFVDLTPDVAVYFSVHPNPSAPERPWRFCRGIPASTWSNRLATVISWPCIQNAWCVLTDGGGLQEKRLPSASRCCVLREVTERPEAVAPGVVDLVGTSRQRGVRCTARAL